MKTIFIFLVLSLFTSNMFSSEHNDPNAASKKAITQFLIKNCPYSDSNPTWQEDADEINDFLVKLIKKKYKAEDEEDLKIKALLLLYKNSRSDSEDSVDVQRIGRRRSLCFIILSLLSSESQFGVFLSDAEYSLKSAGIHDYEQVAITNLFHILRLYDDENIAPDSLKYTIEAYKEEFTKKKGNVQSKKFVSEYDTLLRQITAK